MNFQNFFQFHSPIHTWRCDSHAWISLFPSIKNLPMLFASRRVSLKATFAPEGVVDWNGWNENRVEAKGDSRSVIEKEAVKQRSIKCMEKATEKNKVFSFSLSAPFTYLFNHVFPFSHQTKKKLRERTHKTPIHKIKPIPSLSWANCLLEVCWRFCVDMKIAFFSFRRFVLQETVFISFSAPLIMCYS